MLISFRALSGACFLAALVLCAFGILAAAPGALAAPSSNRPMAALMSGSEIVFDDMEHGDPFGNGYFAFGGAVGGGGIGSNASVPPVNGGTFSLETGWGSGGVPGFFGGFGRTNPVDLSGTSYFTFWINPDAGQDYLMEINLQDDDNGDGATSSPEDDEFQYNCVVSPTGPCAISGGGWQRVEIPLADFFDDNSFLTGGNGVLDAVPTSAGGNGQLINVVFAIISNSGADVTFRTDYWAFGAIAQVCHTSDASGVQYGDGWQDGDNDGTGFGPWSFLTTSTDPSQNGVFIGDATLNGDGDSNGDGDVNTAGRAWGLYANSGQIAQATRQLGSPVEDGGSVSVTFDNGFVGDIDGTVNFVLTGPSGSLLEFGFREGETEYFVSDASGDRSSEVPFTDEGLAITIEIVSSGGDYDMRITPLGGGGTTVVSGIFASGGTVAGGVVFANFTAGADPPRDLFVNSLEACYPVDNRPPVAAATVLNEPPVLAGQTVTLSGSGSSDPDGDPLGYAWTLTGPGYTNESLTGEAPSFCAAEDGEYTATLTVSDLELTDESDPVVVMALSASEALDALAGVVAATPGLNGGQINALTRKLTQAQRKLDRGQDPAGQLDAFRSQVRSLEAESVLTAEQADALVASVDAITGVLASPCSDTATIGDDLFASATLEAEAAFGLAAPYPNPTSGRATIAFTVEDATEVRLAVYDALGRQVAVLLEGSVPAGRHERTLDGAELVAGTYLVRLTTADGQVAMQRLTRLR